MTNTPIDKLRQALAELKCGELSAHAGHVTAEKSEEWCWIDLNCNLASNKMVGRPLARAIAAAVNAAPALLAEVESLRAALQQIASIEDQMEGGDWQEIEEAREIAEAALKEQPK